MAEQTYDPANYDVDEVNGYLATADDDERGRVLQAERDGKARKGILEGPHNPAPEGDEPTGLASTGNPLDLATRPDTTSNTNADVSHQEGAPEELTKVADESAARGFFGDTSEKPDYSQANADVMNGGGKS